VYTTAPDRAPASSAQSHVLPGRTTVRLHGTARLVVGPKVFDDVKVRIDSLDGKHAAETTHPTPSNQKIDSRDVSAGKAFVKPSFRISLGGCAEIPFPTVVYEDVDSHPRAQAGVGVRAQLCGNIEDVVSPTTRMATSRSARVRRTLRTRS